MKNTGVKVKVDYYKGMYTVTGMYNNKIVSESTPITYEDTDGNLKRNFSMLSIWSTRREMKKNLKEIHEEYPEFKFSKKLIKNVDPLMYKSLKSWDGKAGTSYASDYLKTMVQTFNERDFAKTSQGTYEEKCTNARKKDLKKYGMNISYDVALFKTSRKISLLDRIRGFRIAKKQEKLASVKVKKSIIMEDRKFSIDIDALKKAKVKSVKKQHEIPKEEGRWTRKICSEKDSIRNKEFLHKESTKKILINSAITLLAAGAIFNANMINHLKPSNYDIPITEQASDSDKNYSKIDDDSKFQTNFEFFDNGDTDSQDDNNKSEKNFSEITFEVEDDEESIEEGSNKENTNEDQVAEKSDEKKMEEFRKIATQKCMDAFIIGEKPKVGNMLDDQYYSQNRDGSGTIGYFNTHPDSIVGRIIVEKKDGTKEEIIETEGMTLSDVLAEFPEYKDYYIHFAKQPEEVRRLDFSDYRGFINKDKLEQLIQSQVDSIIESKSSQNLELVSDDGAR